MHIVHRIAWMCGVFTSTMYVCFVCVCACVRACVCVCMYSCMCVCVCVYMRALFHVHMSTAIFKNMEIQCLLWSRH